jgi:tRNA(fMet)-specific endonuclease VapC
MILDTTFLIDLLDRDPDAIETLDDLIESTSPVSLSTLTVFEVGVGLRENERERFEDIIDSMTVLPLGPTESWQAVRIQRALRDAGQQIGVMDVLIAGTATEQSDPTVLTRNVDEFERVDAIAVETY